MQVYTFEFDTPPSINKAYKDTPRRARTGKYYCWRSNSKAKNDWEEVAKVQVWRESITPPPPDSKWRIFLDVGLDNKRADVDGPVKFAIDLVADRLGLNDSNLLEYHVYRMKGRSTAATVELEDEAWLPAS